jgi:4-amino-4-deoxy-L-arabinose transferase-like glycosyltransferase
MSISPKSGNSHTHSKWIPFWLFLIAFALRLVVLLFTIDVPGDGPTRAIQAFQWFHAPSMMISGVWLPGNTYLHGLFYVLLDDPTVTSRLVNLFIGSLTVVILYFLVLKVFDPLTALLTGIILTLLPIHIGLSATSLTEPTFLFEVLTGSLFLVSAANTKSNTRYLFLTAAVLVLALSVMTRYEGWVLAPIFVAYYYAKTRSRTESILVLCGLFLYPLIWTYGNYLHTGDPFLGFSQAKGWYHGVKPVGAIEAAQVISEKSTKHLGYGIAIAVIVGLFLLISDIARRRFSLDKAFYLLLFAVYSTIMYRFTLDRGWDLWDRYLLFGFVLALPLAVSPFARLTVSWQPRWRNVLVVLVLLFPMLYKPKLYDTLDHLYNDFYVTLWRPHDITQISSWLQEGPYRDYVILLTEIEGQSWYLPTYVARPELQHCVFAYYAEDHYVRSCLDLGDHVLFVTSDQDRDVQSRIETLIGGFIEDQMLVHTEGDIRVYDISRTPQTHTSD